MAFCSDDLQKENHNQWQQSLLQNASSSQKKKTTPEKLSVVLFDVKKQLMLNGAYINAVCCVYETQVLFET